MELIIGKTISPNIVIILLDFENELIKTHTKQKRNELISKMPICICNKIHIKMHITSTTICNILRGTSKASFACLYIGNGKSIA